jgi:hypothetical protein
MNPGTSSEAVRRCDVTARPGGSHHFGVLLLGPTGTEERRRQLHVQNTQWAPVSRPDRSRAGCHYGELSSAHRGGFRGSRNPPGRISRRWNDRSIRPDASCSGFRPALVAQRSRPPTAQCHRVPSRALRYFGRAARENFELESIRRSFDRARRTHLARRIAAYPGDFDRDLALFGELNSLFLRGAPVEELHRLEREARLNGSGQQR